MAEAEIPHETILQANNSQAMQKCTKESGGNEESSQDQNQESTLAYRDIDSKKVMIEEEKNDQNQDVSDTNCDNVKKKSELRSYLPDDLDNGEFVADDKTDEDNETEEADEDDYSIGNPELLTPMDRNTLFEKGVSFLDERKKKSALKCFQACIKGLNETNGFTYLPNCLRKIADIYYGNGELEKAIQFIQAEKMYYETALIDTSTIQKKLDSVNVNSDPEGLDSEPDKPEVVRADEYENLARICLENKQAQLALEYQAKATKIRQQVLGDDHQITLKSLDFFTVVYAEVGKIQYSESMQKLGNERITGTPIDRKAKKKLTTKKSKVAENGPSDAEQIEDQIRKREQDEFVTRVVLWILFFIWVVVLSLIMFYLYCKIDVSSRSCAAWRADIHYYYMRLKYFIYTSFSLSQNTYG